MRSLPVADTTAARAVQLQEHLGVSSDTLVGIALELTALFLDEQTNAALADYPVITRQDGVAALALARDHGRQWQEILGAGGRASRQLAEAEDG